MVQALATQETRLPFYWFVEQQHFRRLKHVRNADSQAPLQPYESDLHFIRFPRCFTYTLVWSITLCHTSASLRAGRQPETYFQAAKLLASLFYR